MISYNQKKRVKRIGNQSFFEKWHYEREYNGYELQMIPTDASSLQQCLPSLSGHTRLAVPLTPLTALTQSVLISLLIFPTSKYWSIPGSVLWHSFLSKEITLAQTAHLKSDKTLSTDLTSLSTFKSHLKLNTSKQGFWSSSIPSVPPTGVSKSVISNFHTSSYLGQKSYNHLFNSVSHTSIPTGKIWSLLSNHIQNLTTSHHHHCHHYSMSAGSQFLPWLFRIYS